MKKLTLALLLIFSCSTAWTADYAKGLAAAEAGDYTTALAELKPFAEQGDAVAQFHLGVIHTRGQGVIKDDKEAVKWYGLSAEQGMAAAQFNLANMYADGRSLIEDDKEAVKWYRLAAEQGMAVAQFNLANMYIKGEGVLKDDKEAVKWLRLAAEQGMARAQTQLGTMYEKGHGVVEDDEMAARWYTSAANKGNPLAKERLSILFDQGVEIYEEELIDEPEANKKANYQVVDVSSESNEFTILQCVSQADRRYWRTNKDYWGNSTSTQAGSVETYVRLIAFRDSDHTVLIKGESCLKKTDKLDNDWYIAKSTAFDENTINATFEATKLCALSRAFKKSPS